MSSAAPDRVAQVEGLDKLLGHRSRLAVLVLLSDDVRLTFKRLGELLGETDGNLGAHLRKLDAAGYITADQERVGRRQTRWYSITKEGSTAVRAHLDSLTAFLESFQADDVE